tara:strand:- start:8126 stop:8512 length:387 start_codon:yes stop_codon:yes gene_type:complete
MRFDAQFVKYRGESVVVDFGIEHLENDPHNATVYADPVFLLLDSDNKILVSTANTISNNQYLGYSYLGVSGNAEKAFSNYNFIIKPSVSLLQTQSSKYNLDIYFKHLVHIDYVIIKRITMHFDSSYNI